MSELPRPFDASRDDHMTNSTHPAATFKGGPGVTTVDMPVSPEERPCA